MPTTAARASIAGRNGALPWWQGECGLGAVQHRRGHRAAMGPCLGGREKYSGLAVIGVDRGRNGALPWWQGECCAG